MSHGLELVRVGKILIPKPAVTYQFQKSKAGESVAHRERGKK